MYQPKYDIAEFVIISCIVFLLVFISTIKGSMQVRKQKYIITLDRKIGSIKSTMIRIISANPSEIEQAKRDLVQSLWNWEISLCSIVEQPAEYVDRLI